MKNQKRLKKLSVKCVVCECVGMCMFVHVLHFHFFLQCFNCVVLILGINTKKIIRKDS